MPRIAGHELGIWGVAITKVAEGGLEREGRKREKKEPSKERKETLENTARSLESIPEISALTGEALLRNWPGCSC